MTYMPKLDTSAQAKFLRMPGFHPEATPAFLKLWNNLGADLSNEARSMRQIRAAGHPGSDALWELAVECLGPKASEDKVHFWIGEQRFSRGAFHFVHVFESRPPPPGPGVVWVHVENLGVIRVDRRGNEVDRLWRLDDED